MKKTPMWGGPEADGISIACKETLVERNASLSEIVDESKLMRI